MNQTLALPKFKDTISPFFLEEPIDFILYRPFAYLLVKAIWSIPITPNQVSLFAFFVSVWGGISLQKGTPEGFFIGGACVFLFSIIDCCDGMIARVKKNGSPYGEQVDMFVDLLSNITFFVSIFIGLGKQAQWIESRHAIWLSGFFILIHSSIYRYFKEELIFYLRGNPEGRERKLEKIKKDREFLGKKKGSIVSRFLLFLYVLFFKVQLKTTKRSKYRSDSYIEINKKILPFWAIIAGSTHLTVLSIALMLDYLKIYFLYSIFLANLWALFVYFVQIGANSTIEAGK